MRLVFGPMATELDDIRKTLGLKSLTVDHLHPQIAENPIEYEHKFSRSRFFGPPIYSKKIFFMQRFLWETADGRKFSVLLEPHVKTDQGYPQEDDISLRKELIKKIKETLVQDTQDAIILEKEPLLLSFEKPLLPSFKKI